MLYGEAIVALKEGCKLARKKWEGSGTWVEIENTEDPEIHLNLHVYNGGIQSQWKPSKDDLQADDWLTTEKVKI